MKNICFSKIKPEIFNLQSIIEESISIDIKNPKKSFKEIINVLYDLEGLKEALFFKTEKLNKQLNQKSNFDPLRESHILGQYVNKLKIPFLANSRNLLEKNREILELKTVQKLLKYSIELKTNSDKLLNCLLNSEVKQDWLFLSELLFYMIKFGNTETTNDILNCSKKLEEKMENTFTDSIKTGDITTCKTVFETLRNLGKETLVLDKFLYSSNFLITDFETEPPVISVINLDDLNLINDSFEIFIQKIIDNLGNNSQNFNMIFGSRIKYIEYTFEKLFRTKISKNLEIFLNISNSGLFLMCLTSSFSKMEYLIRFIKCEFSGFDAELYLSEIIAPYFSKAIQKEKQFFDEIFDIMVYDAKTLNKYILIGEQIKSSENYLEIFEKLLCIINLMDKRKKLFYTQEEERELLRYFYRRAISLLEKIVAKESCKIKVINQLSHIYLLTKRYLGRKLMIVEDFVKCITSFINEAFEESIESCTAQIKNKISNLYFLKVKDYENVLHLMKSFIKDAETLKGKNLISYSNRIIDETYQKLYKQIFYINYDKDQSIVLVKCIDDFLGYLSFVNRTNMVMKFSHLKDLCKLITCEIKDFLLVYRELTESISEKELKELVKCRRDKEEIRVLLLKLEALCPMQRTQVENMYEKQTLWGRIKGLFCCYDAKECKKRPIKNSCISLIELKKEKPITSANLSDKNVDFKRIPKCSQKKNRILEIEKINCLDSNDLESDSEEYYSIESEGFCLPPKLDTKPTLVLDLDNTLLYPTNRKPEGPSHEIQIRYNGKFQSIWFIERPHLQEFIEELTKHYEVIVFTAGIWQYGAKVMRKIDKKSRISYLLDRKFCTVLGKNSKNQDLFIKNLSILGRDLKKTIIIDDREYSYILNVENGQLIPAFNGDPNDDVLLNLMEFLLSIKDSDDLRNRKKMNFH